MKYVLLVVLVLSALMPVAYGQEKEKTAADLKAEIAALQSKLEDQKKDEARFVSKFAGFGKELGTTMNSFVEAMDGGMKVTTVRVNEFAKTDVGRFAMVAIAWKVFAEDFGAIGQSAFNKISGLILLAVFCWLLKRTLETLVFGRMIVTERTGPWWNSRVKKERTIPLVKTSGIEENSFVAFVVLSGLALVALFISAAIGLCH